MPGWTFRGFCDNNICYDSIVIAGDTKESNKIPPAFFSDFHAVLNGDPAATPSHCWVKVLAKDSVHSYQKNYVFVGFKASTGIRSVITEDEVVVFPNPATDKLHIIISNNLVRSVSLTSITGAVLHSTHTIQKDLCLDLNNWAPGLYHLLFRNEEGAVIGSRNFIKQ